MLQFKYLSNRRISTMDTESKINLILDIIKNNQIIIIDGKLQSQEEALLIRKTMDFLNDNIEKFQGLEIATIYDNEHKSIKSRMAEFFFKERNGLTLIGPAKIISELKQHPDMIEMHFTNNNMKAKRR